MVKGEERGDLVSSLLDQVATIRDRVQDNHSSKFFKSGKPSRLVTAVDDSLSAVSRLGKDGG